MCNVLMVKTDSEMSSGCNVINLISDVIGALDSYMTCGFRAVVVFKEQGVLFRQLPYHTETLVEYNLCPLQFLLLGFH